MDGYSRKGAMRTALITGITGQDGSYLAELLLDQGYEVWGMVRRSSTENFERIEHLRDRIELIQGDLWIRHPCRECWTRFDPTRFTTSRPCRSCRRAGTSPS